MTPVNAYAQNSFKLFEKHANPAQAAGMKKYMRDKFEFFGIKSPQQKGLMRTAIGQFGQPPRSATDELIHTLWHYPQRECQYLGMRLFQKMIKPPLPSDLPLFEFMITEKSWWDTVDFIAANLVGPYFRQFPEQLATINHRWLHSTNMWLQRTTLLFQLKYKTDTNAELLFENIRTLIPEQDFFIRKAIGWALREYSKVRPEEVRAFIAAHPELSALSVKEGSKYL